MPNTDARVDRIAEVYLVFYSETYSVFLDLLSIITINLV